MAKIYIIIPYYGNFPNYFQLYLDSISINKDILTVILITDIDITKYSLPENIIVENLTLDNIRERTSNFILTNYIISVEPSKLIIESYKLCDIRPLYRLLFDDILQKNNVTIHDYVGWGDCDLIYGKLSNFIDLNKNYDIIGFHGHFTALKNIDIFTNLYKNIDNLDKLLIDRYYKCIDEKYYRNVLIKYRNINKSIFFNIAKVFADIIPPGFRGTNINDFIMSTKEGINIKYLSFNKISQKLIVLFENNEEQEVIYAHLQKRKMSINFNNYLNSFYIFKDSFSVEL